MNDIITALATAYGESGIAIVRISGEGSAALAERLLCGRKKLSEYPPRTMRLFTLCDNGEAFDEALAVRFEKGSSYTGEESVEIQCHGGMLPAQKCIEILCENGAGIAQPGEFTKRAFLNGRLDLSQAEAVLGIIKAKSGEALAASERTLQGKFTEEIKKFLELLTTLAAQLEVNIDFPEDDTGLLPAEEFAAEISDAVSYGNEIISRCRTGMLLREGINAAIAGKPNVGKSSLLNALLHEERAIVTEIPGTTRDKIEEQFLHKGISVRITDTAGIRNTEDKIEAIGIQTALKAVNSADIVIWLLDSSREFSEEDTKIRKELEGKKYITVLNKCDLPQKISEKEFSKSEILRISAATGEGLETLKDKIITLVSDGAILAESYGVSSRQLECLNLAVNSLNNAREALNSGLGDDVTADCVETARRHAASLLGLDPTEKLLDTVFSDFCVGK